MSDTTIPKRAKALLDAFGEKYKASGPLSRAHILDLICQALADAEKLATWRWTWWKDGAQEVGTCGTLSADEIARIDKEAAGG